MGAVVELNLDQLTLAKWIHSGICIEEIRGLHGDGGYLLSNMVAKYSLASGSYLLSTGSHELLASMDVDLNTVHKRSRFHGKKSPFIYEHAIPVSIVRDKLLASAGSLESVIELLNLAGPVAMILRDEDNYLNELGLQRRMPTGWEWDNHHLARYCSASIKISAKTIIVSGRLMR